MVIPWLGFPLGDLTKAETRWLAARHALPVAEKPESQDICFVPTGGYAAVVERLRPGAAEPGEIVHVDGRVLGRHDGVICYTVGQRRGIGVGGGEPLYVVRLDAAQRRVVVGPKAALARDIIRVRDVNWLGDRAAAQAGVPVTVKLRSAQPAVPARFVLAPDGSGGEVRLDAPQHGVAPGQAAVCYRGDRVLGGGWIADTALSAAAAAA